ncbi:MAG: response regulator [Candidatus Omnitrophica bacterium]|nr:response regulator [Candidatus Omnitrophota bacterium]
MECICKIVKDFFVPPKTTLKVLVIDDSLIDRTVVIKALDARYQVISADSGKAGIETAYALAPDLIILDYMMQDMNGPQVCGVLRNDARTKDIPVIFLTSMDAPRSFINGLEQGADAYLTKPVNVRDLKGEVALRIKQRA